MLSPLKMLAAAALLWPGLASAATVAVEYTTYAPSNVGLALSARDAFIGGVGVVGEDFEGFVACPTTGCASGTISTALGTFTGIGPGITNGGSQVEPKNQIVVRTGTPAPFGRTNVTPFGAKWLDSNDMTGIAWSVLTAGAKPISRLAFILSDLDDVKSFTFQITVNGTGLASTIVPRTGDTKLSDGMLTLVTMLFDTPTSDVTIRMVNGTGDGFGFDGARVSAVPLPAGGLLLLGAMAGLAALRRRRA